MMLDWENPARALDHTKSVIPSVSTVIHLPIVQDFKFKVMVLPQSSVRRITLKS